MAEIVMSSPSLKAVPLSGEVIDIDGLKLPEVDTITKTSSVSE